jgi:hypothetical protein
MSVQEEREPVIDESPAMPVEEAIIQRRGGMPSPIDNFWLDTLRSAKKESVGKLEEAAKQLITVTSLTQTIYFAAISFSDAKKGLGQIQSPVRWLFIILLSLPLLFWIPSLIFTIRVFKPENYDVNLSSPTFAKQTLERIISYKSKYLQRAYRLLAIGFMFAALALFTYLVFIPVKEDPPAPTTSTTMPNNSFNPTPR